MSFWHIEENVHLVTDFYLMGERNLGDEVNAGEVGVDIVFMAKQLSDGHFDLVWRSAIFLEVFFIAFMDVFWTDSIDDRMSPLAG